MCAWSSGTEIGASSGYDQPAVGSRDWDGPLNETFGRIEQDVRTLADGLAAIDDGDGSDAVGGYAQPDEGAQDWHEPLNDNFAAIESDVRALADRVAALDGGADRSAYGGYAQPTQGTQDWHEPVDGNVAAITSDLVDLQNRLKTITDDPDRKHWYSFEATGDSYADYYIEVEDGGDMIPATVDGAVIEYEYFWISDDSTKAAGRVDPGETHAYEFDTLVADVTIEGEARPTVNGSESDLSLYPREPASGDYWKSGFPWQEDSHTPPGGGGIGIRHGRYEGPLGGGDGMPEELVYDRSEADVVVTNGDVDGALDRASPGDVVYVAGSASGFTVDVPEVTVAGNRGIGSDGQITSAIEIVADDVRLDGLTVDPGGGHALEIRAQYPVCYNCAFVNAGGMAIRFRRENTASTFTQCRFHNWTKYGFHHNYNAHDRDHKNTIEYCEFSDLGRHCVNAENTWYHVRDCHMHGSMGNLDPDHFMEVRAPNEYGVNGSAPVECGAPCGNAIVEHNLHELSNGGKTRLVVVRGVPTDGVWVRKTVRRGTRRPKPAAGRTASSVAGPNSSSCKTLRRETGSPTSR